MEKISVKASGNYDIIIEDGILNKTGVYLSLINDIKKKTEKRKELLLLLQF